jgi:methionine synthase I (cobalamin-dependent)
MMSRFLEALKERVVLGDGAMGTELLARGAAKDRNLSLLNLENSALVLQVHREYVAAGAEFIRTNTFTANRLRMPPGLVREVNSEGVRLARAAAGPGRFVAGSMGSLQDVETTDQERRAAYLEQGRALADGGCDALVLETFGSIVDLLQAIDAGRQAGVPVIAQTYVAGLPLSQLSLERSGAQVAGANCTSCGECLRIILQFAAGREATPLSAFPNAGPPARYEPPDSFAAGAMLLIQKGVRLIGGCCGTAPAHIRALGAKLAEKSR